MPKSQPKKPAKQKPKASPAKASKPAVKVSVPKARAKAPAPKSKVPAKAKAPAPKAKAPAPKARAPKKKAKAPAKPPVKVKVPVKATKAQAPVKKATKTDPKKLEKAKKLVTKATAREKAKAKKTRDEDEEFIVPRVKGPVKITPFQKAQREKLQALRDLILDSMAGVAKDTLRSRPEGGEASAFGMHQADAGSDAYDKDFALSLLSQEQDALYEIEEAMKRVDAGTYGICEMSGKQIMIARLEALPFARYTVECQAELERTKRHQRSRVPVTSLFGLTDSEEEDADAEESEETPTKTQTEE